MLLGIIPRDLRYIRNKVQPRGSGLIMYGNSPGTWSLKNRSVILEAKKLVMTGDVSGTSRKVR